MLHVVHRNARRMLLLLNDVLDLARARSGTLRHQPDDVDLDAAVARVLGDLGATLPDVQTSVPPTLVHADPNHVEQILSNLLTNAARHGAPPIRVSATVPEPGTVEIEIRDAGPGVAPELVDSLWDWFTRDRTPGTDPRGVGVGLAIVRLLTETNGGAVSYRPGVPVGAVFTVRLPGDVRPSATAPSSTDTSAATVTRPRPVVDAPDDDEAERIAARATRQVLHASDADEIVGIVLTATHRLGGWTVPARLADDRALPIDLSFGRSETLLPAADGHSRARDHLERHLPSLIDDALRALDLLSTRGAEPRPDDPSTGLLNQVGLRRALERLDAPGAVVRLELRPVAPASDDTYAQAAADARPPEETVAAFAHHLRGQLRITDLAGRTADEAFVVVLPGVADGRADQVLDRLARGWAAVAPIEVRVLASVVGLDGTRRDPDAVLAELADARPRDWQDH
jgi:anti-sigma regulatory factor (Ser/Thr protein kinase)